MFFSRFSLIKMFPTELLCSTVAVTCCLSRRRPASIQDSSQLNNQFITQTRVHLITSFNQRHDVIRTTSFSDTQ